MSAFACHGCGQCCRQLGQALASAQAAPAGSPYQLAAGAFPYEPLPDGSCPQLGPDNKCQVYATRPVLCNVEEFYERYLDGVLPRAEWYALNASQCPGPEAGRDIF
jgi:Fe-S-cluster containining protein